MIRLSLASRPLLGLSALAFAGLAVGQLAARPDGRLGAASGRDQGGVASGADVIVGAIPNVSAYGAVTVGGVTWMAYAFGTTSCNIGNQPLEWFAQPDPRHPFIPMNAYRYRNGRFEQIGLGWGKHGFAALQGTLCGPCQSSGTSTYLGVGCSDPYSSGLNGSQSGLGTRTEVNAATGVFPGTFNQGMPTAPATIGRRVQIKADDLNPALNSGALYVAEGHYIHQQDATAGNDDNNASYRTFTVGNLSGGSYPMTLTGPTVQQKPAIEAWKAFDPLVTLVPVDVPGDGRFIVGYRVSDLGGGSWRYEYAVHNLNSHRSGQSFSVPVPDGVTLSGVGFKDVPYHSGDPYLGTDWTPTQAGGAMTWAGGTFASNPNSNALRFATLYNFWFIADRPPETATGTIGLFRPSTGTAPNSVAFAIAAPSSPADPADLNGDGSVGPADLASLLALFGPATPGGPGDIDGSGNVDALDLATLLSRWTG
jgi:type IV secretory pathway TrbD component